MAASAQFWLIKNKSTGHAVVSYGTAPTAPAILKALGAKTAADVQTFGMGTNFQDGIDKAFGQLGIVTDTIPTTFNPVKGTDIMGVNFDPLVPSVGGGLDQALVNQGGGAAQSAVNTVTGALSIAQLFTSIGFWKGVALCIGGGILVLLGLLQLTGHGTPSPTTTAAKLVKA